MAEWDDQQSANDTVTPPSAITIPGWIWREVIGHLRNAMPAEGCGLLAGSGPRARGAVVHFFPGTNELRSARRYRMAGKEVIDAHRTMRERGWWLAAVVHSHPRGSATPSATDLREAHYPEAALVIVDLFNAEPVARVWTLRPGERTAAEIELRIE